MPSEALDPIRVTRVTVTHFAWETPDLGLEEQNGFDWVYRPGERLRLEEAITRVETDIGITGESLGAVDERSARYLLGRNPLEREIIWHDLKRAARGALNAPPEGVDVALWDIAGKLYNVPIHQLLGGWRLKIPCQASTYHGDENGGLTRPEDYAEFALRCRDEYHYPAFKIHGWVSGPIEREVATVLAVREAVGDSMELMLDPAGAFSTFADVVRVGQACDEARYFWYEDPFPGGGFSLFAHNKLRQFVKTPFLVGEHVRGLEAKADLIHSGAADYIRTSTFEEGGITGIMKTAALAEAFGLDVELHGGNLAHRHCLAAIRNSNYYELGLAHPKAPQQGPPIYEDVRWLERLDSVDEDGSIDVPTGPGLGVPFDWSWVKAHEIGVVVYK